MPEDFVRVVRILVYEGPRSAVEKTLSRSGVPLNGVQNTMGGNQSITSTMLGNFPEVLHPIFSEAKVDVLPSNAGNRQIVTIGEKDEDAAAERDGSGTVLGDGPERS